MDETYVKVKGEWRYLYRAVDKYGHTIDVLLTEHRDHLATLVDAVPTGDGADIIVGVGLDPVEIHPVEASIHDSLEVAVRP